MPPVPRPGTAKKGPNRTQIYVLVGAAVAVAAVIAGVLLLTSDDEAGSVTATPNLALMDGIPQDGIVLGSPDATVRMIEYADLACPVCKAYAEGAFAGIVEQYVQPGKVKLEFRGLAFLPPPENSDKALRFALAAGEQDKLWQFVDTVYLNQGEEGTAWFTDEFARGVAATIPGLDADKLFADAESQKVKDQVAEMAAQGEEDQVQGTPTFFVQTGVDKPYLVQPPAFTPEAFAPIFDDALSG